MKELTASIEKEAGALRGLAGRIGRFLAKPPREKLASVSTRLEMLSASIPRLVRLPFGEWWLARNDHVGRLIRKGQFEAAERAFVERFLRPGMTVLDLGAHHGFYTLLASKKVGSRGKVIAFEPSTRERRILRRHVRLNRCGNVMVEECALGREDGEADLYVVEGMETGCNSLRPPNVVGGSTRRARVRVVRLEDWLRQHEIKPVDFIKMDVEGAELEVLEGTGELLSKRPRPVILAEVYDVRSFPWGYRAREIVGFLHELGYEWFELLADGGIAGIAPDREAYDANLVAVPEERAAEVGCIFSHR